MSIGDTKNKGKVGSKASRPGDIGFLKLGFANNPTSYKDGKKIVQVKYDYCSFNSDCAAKKELFIGILLRAYSQEVFNPEKIYGENKSEGVFVEKIESVLTKFIIEDNSKRDHWPSHSYQRQYLKKKTAKKKHKHVTRKGDTSIQKTNK